MIYYKDFDYTILEDYRTECKYRQSRNKEMRRYLVNIPFSFDIETSTIYNAINNEPRSFMYIWMFGINGTAVYGRTWDEFKDFLNRFKDALILNERKYAVVYIHNAGFELEFLHSIIKISNVFARATHSPIYFDAPEYCIEFRDSYILSGLKLEKVADNLSYHKIEKMVGDLDYSKVRTSITPLTETELKYCENDVLILNYFIAEEIAYNADNITKIPLTRTGYARRRFKTALHSDPEFWEQWHKYIYCSYPTKEQFILLNKCFAGGYVHGNCNYTNMVCEDVTSIDFSSSYPCQLIRHKYPLGKWHKVDTTKLTYKKFKKHIDHDAVICEITFENIKAKTAHHIISKSKCDIILDDVTDNGRVVSAKCLKTFITDVDYRIIAMFYTFDSIAVQQMYTNVYEYLPTPFINELLNLYGIKTTLKDVKGKEDEYQRGKADLNSAYGMVCTSPVDPEISFNDGVWEVQKAADIDIAECLKQHRKSHGYFMPYQVGVYCTAFARYELLKMVYEIDKGDEFGDVLYNDTDSIKMMNYKKHKAAIDAYNEKCVQDLQKALDHHGIDPYRVKPKTQKGKVKQLGVFELDAQYKYFKQLGAKRYSYVPIERQCFIDNPYDFHYTSSGIPKGKPLEYMIQQAIENDVHPFDIFTFGLKIPPAFSGNLTHYCFDDDFYTDVIDYMGNRSTEHITSCCTLIQQPYEMSMNRSFLNFLKGIKLNMELHKELPSFKGKHPELKISILD